jgi:DNA-binding MarR family transcriptional regulator
MTKLVRALEGAKLVSRKVDAEDRRVTWISATDKGRKLLMKGRAERVRALAERLQAFSTDDVESLDEAAKLILEVATGL